VRRDGALIVDVTGYRLGCGAGAGAVLVDADVKGRRGEVDEDVVIEVMKCHQV
jgi:hypothetical protein